MWIRFLARTRWKPTTQAVIRYEAGQVVNLPAAAAREMTDAGKAVTVKSPKKEPSSNIFVDGEDGAKRADMISADQAER